MGIRGGAANAAIEYMIYTTQTWKIGDCLKLLPELPENSVDLIVTSPPYYNTKEYSHWDSYDEYLNWLRHVLIESLRVLKDGRMCCVNISTIIEPRTDRSHESKRIPLPFHFIHLAEQVGFKFIEDIIWAKPDGSSKNRNAGFFVHRQPMQYKPNCVTEYLFVIQKPMDGLIDDILREYTGNTKQESLVKGDYQRTNIWYINPETRASHPAPFPVELVKNCILYYSYVGDVICDPFLGSGTTLEACRNTNRNCVGFEISDEWEDCYANRCLAHTPVLQSYF